MITVPARSDTVLVTTDSYNAAGWLQDVVDPRGIKTRTSYDALHRATQTVQDYTNGTLTNNIFAINDSAYAAVEAGTISGSNITPTRFPLPQ